MFSLVFIQKGKDPKHADEGDEEGQILVVRDRRPRLAKADGIQPGRDAAPDAQQAADA